MFKTLYSFFAIVLCFSTLSIAQISEGGSPIQLQKIQVGQASPFPSEAPTVYLPKPNISAAKNEDLVNDPTGPYRVGITLPVSITMDSEGIWSQLPDGTKVWRLSVFGTNAMALGLYFGSEVKIPAGGKLFVYNKNGKQILGAYTSSTDGFQAMEMVQGEKLTIEYQAAPWVTEKPVFHISEVAYFYRGVEDHIAAYTQTEQTKAESCQVDVACSEGSNWSNQIKSVVHFTFNDGTGVYVCSGSTINTTAGACKPYILTAWHCGERNAGSSISSWVWYWGYQKTTCATGSANANDPNPGSKTMTGGTVRSSSGNGNINTPTASNGQVKGSDFYLVELNSQPPASYNVYYAGWNRTNTAATSGVGIHHPAGSAKKISTFTSTAQSSSFNGGVANAHWSVVWAQTANGRGVTEGGSSGSPLFNQNGQIVGQLTGGSSACTNGGAGPGTGPNGVDLYGKMFTNWDQNGAADNCRLKPWLDPTNTGATSINGIAAPCTVTSIAPVADFVANPTTVSTGGNSQLTDLSTNSPTTWAWVITPATGWSFINGTSASSQNPQINFTTNGFYTVQLTASNSAGSDVEIKTNYIQVTSISAPCTASSSQCDEFIQRVTLGTIDNTSGCTNYTNYNQSTTLAKGQTYSITILPQIQTQSPGTAYTGDEIAAWIDFNGDFDFTDAGERIAFVSIQQGSSLTFSFTVPANATIGTVKMRVRITYNGPGGDGPISPCGTTEFGEVEDYTIVITNSLGIESNSLQQVSIYPNPTNEYMTIDLSAINKENLSLEVLDLTGKRVMKLEETIADQMKLDLSQLATGTYQLLVTNGVSHSIHRIVKR